MNVLGNDSVSLPNMEMRRDLAEFMNLTNNRVLIVDDQPEIHRDFSELLRPRFAKTTSDHLAAMFEPEEPQRLMPNIELIDATSGEQACQIITSAQESNTPIAVAFIDIRMPPGIDGVETIRRVRQIDREIEIVIMTAYSDKPLPEIIRDMELLHKLLYIRKPFAREEIQQMTLSLLGKWNVERELSEKQRQLTASHQRLEAVLNSTDDAMAMYNVSGKLVFANWKYTKMFEMTENELKKVPPETLTDRFRKHYSEADRPGDSGRILFEGRRDGMGETPEGERSTSWMFYRSVDPVCDSRGQVSGELHVYRDVSRDMEVEQMKAEVLRLRHELEGTYSFDGMVGSSNRMQDVYRLMRTGADSDISVLIMGESGTGKELVAKSIHYSGLRKAGPFVVVNCAAIPETLVETELFGHEEAAFTGATKRRAGAFERAHGGTVFLDEIGEMQQSLQAKLLRVLQEREVHRIGGSAPIPVDIRVIAATNKDMETAVQSGDFREDLYYRISAFPISIPPLRERRDDIPPLARHFVEKHAQGTGESVVGISVAAMRLLVHYNWPGNVRELENAIERALLLEGTDVLQANALPPRLWQGAAIRTDKPTSEGITPLAEIEHRALVHALEVSDNNVSKAARSLGINRATLYRKLKKYGLSTGNM